MRKYLYCENGFVEKPQWMPNCWVNVECPDQSDFEFLTKELKVPEAFLEDIADMDERPRTDTEDNWLLTIIRIPLQQQGSIPYITIPIGIITNNEIIVTVCYHSTEMIPDFIDHTRRKGIIVPNKFELIFHDPFRLLFHCPDRLKNIFKIRPVFSAKFPEPAARRHQRGSSGKKQKEKNCLNRRTTQSAQAVIQNAHLSLSSSFRRPSHIR